MTKEKTDRRVNVNEASMSELAEIVAGTLSKLSLPLEQHQVLQIAVKRLTENAIKGEADGTKKTTKVQK